MELIYGSTACSVQGKRGTFWDLTGSADDDLEALVQGGGARSQVVAQSSAEILFNIHSRTEHCSLCSRDTDWVSSVLRKESLAINTG